MSPLTYTIPMRCFYRNGRAAQASPLDSIDSVLAAPNPRLVRSALRTDLSSQVETLAATFNLILRCAFPRIAVTDRNALLICLGLMVTCSWIAVVTFIPALGGEQRLKQLISLFGSKPSWRHLHRKHRTQATSGTIPRNRLAKGGLENSDPTANAPHDYPASFGAHR